MDYEKCKTIGLQMIVLVACLVTARHYC